MNSPPNQTDRYACYQGMPRVMGILNITPDSFADGGQFVDPDNALKHALRMIDEGADIIDIGAESTRPGADVVSVDEELSRLEPILKRLKESSDTLLSVDTNKPEVMQAAVEMGAGLINDVYALRQPRALETAAELDVPICLMHMRGEPQTMQQDLDEAEAVCDSVHQFFKARIKACIEAGIAKERLILDVGFGFGKTVQQNLTLINSLSSFNRYGLPLLIGVSRKSTIGAVLNQPVDKRLSGGLALNVFSALQGVRIIRTHDVAETKQALLMLDHVMQTRGQDSGS